MCEINVVLCSYRFTATCGRTRRYRSLSGCPRTHGDWQHPSAPLTVLIRKYITGAALVKNEIFLARRSLQLPLSLSPLTVFVSSFFHSLSSMTVFLLYRHWYFLAIFLLLLRRRLHPQWRPRSGGHVGGRQHRSYLEFHVCWLWRQCKCRAVLDHPAVSI